ncbi:MAG: fibrobacter succinogenes major paralogous domain-containing protein [Prevotellaceae bacterium]|nr:fibrobacter succinogenes major paralogous domain-containing protein [Prevotellaceae bacterium]
MCTQNAGRGTGNHGICPAGWSVPTHAAWATMLNSVETENKNIGTTTGYQGASVGRMLKTSDVCAASTPQCASDENAKNNFNAIALEARNPYGFNILSSGFRSGSVGLYTSRGYYSYQWSGSALNSQYGWGWVFRSNMNTVASSGHWRTMAFSVRCQRN